MFRTLYGKLAAVLLLLFLAVGAGLVWATAHFLFVYNQEAMQSINLTLARHLAEQNLSVGDGSPDQARLRSLFDMQMAINPSIQIYLLGPDGTIRGHAAPQGQPLPRAVDLRPIRALLDGHAPLPVLGEDPREPGEPKPFSVAPLRDGGYLYVVLAMQKHDGVSRMLAGSVIMRALFGVLAGGLLVVVAVGLILFAFLTRRLVRLATVMEAFQASGFAVVPATGLARSVRGGDEIDRVSATFGEMAGRMVAQLAELRSSDALRRELLANVSHDLKTPLASLQGYVDTLLLKDHSLTAEERRHYLEVASRSSERLAKLVANLVELAKLDAKEVKLAKEPFAIAELLQDVLQKLQLQAEQRGLRLEIEMPPVPPFVCADIALIERVLENLLANAIKHTEAGGRVALRLSTRAGDACIDVADTGCGIAKDELPRIFERFYRVNDDHRARGSHAGLGLAITKSILDLHGVSITVTSEPGVGTTFSFTLPIVPPGGTECGP